jgi:hypothetical protein
VRPCPVQRVVRSPSKVLGDTAGRRSPRDCRRALFWVPRASGPPKRAGGRVCRRHACPLAPSAMHSRLCDRRWTLGQRFSTARPLRNDATGTVSLGHMPTPANAPLASWPMFKKSALPAAHTRAPLSSIRPFRRLLPVLPILGTLHRPAPSHATLPVFSNSGPLHDLTLGGIVDGPGTHISNLQIISGILALTSALPSIYVPGPRHLAAIYLP